MVGGGRPLLPEILGQPSKIADFELIIARSASALTPSEKSSINLMLIGSPLRTFQ